MNKSVKILFNLIHFLFDLAITFDNLEDGQPLPKNVKYSIRLHHSTPNKLGDLPRDSWQTQFVYPFFQVKGPAERE